MNEIENSSQVTFNNPQFHQTKISLKLKPNNFVIILTGTFLRKLNCVTF